MSHLKLESSIRIQNFLKKMNKNILFILMIFLIINFNVSCKKSIVQIDNTLVWQSNFGYNGVSISIVPIIYQNYIIYSANDSSDKKQKLIAFDKKTGKIVWECKDIFTNGAFYLNWFYIYRNIALFAYNNSQYPYILVDLNTGKILNYISETNPNHTNNTIPRGYNEYELNAFYTNENYQIGIYKYNILTGQKQIIFKDTNYGQHKFINNICVYLGKDKQHYLSFCTLVFYNNNWTDYYTYLYKYNLELNKIVNCIKLENIGIHGGSIIYADSNFYLDEGDYNYKINETNFTLFDKFNFPPNTLTSIAYSVVLTNKLFVPTGNNLLCYDVINAFPNPIWADNSYTTKGILNFQPQILNGVIYFGGFGGQNATSGLNAIDINTGQVLWQKLPPNINSGVIGEMQHGVIAVDPETNYVYTADYANALCYKAAR